MITIKLEPRVELTEDESRRRSRGLAWPGYTGPSNAAWGRLARRDPRAGRNGGGSIAGTSTAERV